jgi:hypothetical protein
VVNIHWPLYPRTLVATEQEAEWAPQPVWTFWRRGKFIFLTCGQLYRRWEDHIKWIFMEWNGGRGWIEQVDGCCEYGNEPGGSIKCGKFLD